MHVWLGRLQIPWGRWVVHGAPLVIELDDVSIEATARDDADWEEGPSLQRERATKQAELAAAEIAKLSRRSGWGRWSIIETLATYLLNNLQLSITNVHVRFRAPPNRTNPGDWCWDIAGLLLCAVVLWFDSQTGDTWGYRSQDTQT